MQAPEVDVPEVDVVLVNAPPEEAKKIARAIVEARLAACVNVVPGVVSIYRWEGAVHEEGESMLLIKTRRDLVSALSRLVREVHSYSVPEILVLPADSARSSRAYLDWVRAETREVPA